MNLRQLRDDVRTLRWRHRLVVLCALVYLASPIDLIPDFLPVIGQLDDLALVAWTTRYIARHARTV